MWVLTLDFPEESKWSVPSAAQRWMVMGMLKKMTELVADILNYLPWGEISRTTANEVAAHLLENDVVPVVRCKDCIHENMTTCPLCWIENHTLEFIDHGADDFCSYGERKEDG